MKRPTNEVLGVLAFLANTRGIIPDPINATRVNQRNYVNGVDTAIIYTVPANKILYITSAWLAITESADAAGLGMIFIRDASDGAVAYLFIQRYNKAGQVSMSNQYWPAIEAAAAWDVCVNATHANLAAEAGFSGWLEAV